MLTLERPRRKAVKPAKRCYGPSANGVQMTPREFDRADFERGWQYELVNGVLIVSPTQDLSERDANEHLGSWLRNYREGHPQGQTLDFTVFDHDIETGDNRRRADRAIWTSLGRLPCKNDTPTIVVEFVSGTRRDCIRDDETKRDEYLAVGVREYWVFDRFARTLTVWTIKNGRKHKRVLRDDQTYSTPRLPGFVLAIGRLIELANRWSDE